MISINSNEENLKFNIKCIIFRPKLLYGSLHSFNLNTTHFSAFANFSFHVNENDTMLYEFVPGPVAVVNHSSPVMYMSVQCGTAFQRVILVAFDMQKKTYKQSRWVLDEGLYAYLFYDPQRDRLFGLREVSIFTLIMEEYNMATLEVIQEYTQQTDGQYAYPQGGCVVFDYEENWIVEVRTRFESPSVNAYYVKIDLNLVGKKDDIVTEFYLMPNVGELCSMTYDIKTKTILATWQHGSIDRNLVMIYMNPYTSKFSNETILFKVARGWDIKDTQAIYDEQSRQVLVLIRYENDDTFEGQYWIMLVDFDTMEINLKKEIKTDEYLSDWALFDVYS